MGNSGGADFILRGILRFADQVVVHFFQSHMEVRPAKTKSGDIGAAHLIGIPRLGLRNHAERAGGPIHRRIGCLKINRGRQHLII